MDFSAYIRLMALATVLAWLSWVFVLFRIDPTEAGFASIILFYSTLFLAFVGSFATLGTLFRSRIQKGGQVLSRDVRIAFRHAVLVSMAGLLCLFLAAEHLLTWWNFLGLFIAVGCLEYVFLVVQEGKRS
jgi:hypothetical protein